MSVLLLGWFDASLLDWTLRLYTAAAIGQTLFVALWSVLPWWRTTIGRALMMKSASLMIILDWTLISYHLGPFRHQQGIGTALFALVAIGIWLQVWAIALEMRRGRRTPA